MRSADHGAFPNGVAVTPDNTTLIIAASYGNSIKAVKASDIAQTIVVCVMAGIEHRRPLRLVEQAVGKRNDPA